MESGVQFIIILHGMLRLELSVDSLDTTHIVSY